jgi:hypothetical protein
VSVWAAGVWAAGVWADGVWYDYGAPAEAPAQTRGGADYSLRNQKEAIEAEREFRRRKKQSEISADLQRAFAEARESPALAAKVEAAVERHAPQAIRETGSRIDFKAVARSIAATEAVLRLYQENLELKQKLRRMMDDEDEILLIHAIH